MITLTIEALQISWNFLQKLPLGWKGSPLLIHWRNRRGQPSLLSKNRSIFYTFEGVLGPLISGFISQELIDGSSTTIASIPAFQADIPVYHLHQIQFFLHFVRRVSSHELFVQAYVLSESSNTRFRMSHITSQQTLVNQPWFNTPNSVSTSILSTWIDIAIITSIPN